MDCKKESNGYYSIISNAMTYLDIPGAGIAKDGANVQIYKERAAQKPRCLKYRI